MEDYFKINKQKTYFIICLLIGFFGVLIFTSIQNNIGINIQIKQISNESLTWPRLVMYLIQCIICLFLPMVIYKNVIDNDK